MKKEEDEEDERKRLKQEDDEWCDEMEKKEMEKEEWIAARVNGMNMCSLIELRQRKEEIGKEKMLLECDISVISRPRLFRGQNSPPRVFPRPDALI